MAHIIAFINQKGGVGKTTSAVNTASYLSDMGKFVLLVDLIHRVMRRRDLALIRERCNIVCIPQWLAMAMCAKRSSQRV